MQIRTTMTTQKQYIPLTDYLNRQGFELKLGPLVILSGRFFAPVSIPEFYEKEEFIENSLTFWLQKLIRELDNIYIFDNLKEVNKFLLTNDYLIEILYEAPYYIYRIFGEIPIHLELHHDPEEGWDELFIIIKSTYTAEEVIKLENKLAEEWFLDRMKDTKGKLNITEEPL